MAPHAAADAPGVPHARRVARMYPVPGATASNTGDRPALDVSLRDDPCAVTDQGGPAGVPRSTSRSSPRRMQSSPPLSAPVTRTTRTEPLGVATGVRQAAGADEPGPGAAVPEVAPPDPVPPLVAPPPPAPAPYDVAPPQPARAAPRATTTAARASPRASPSLRRALGCGGSEPPPRARGARPPPGPDHAEMDTEVDAALDGDVGEPLPELVRPMLAVPGELPPPAEDDQWRYEMKWDGVRAVAYARGGTLRLVSRNDLDVSRSYPEVLAPPEALRNVAGVFDGEL